MTMASSKCRCVLLFLFLVSAVFLAADGAVDLKATCSTTAYPELCVSVLSANPESKAAVDARGLALIAIRAAEKLADDASAAVDVYLHAMVLNANSGRKETDPLVIPDTDPTYDCFCECKAPMQTATNKLYGKDDNDRFTNARYFFQDDPTCSWNLGNCDRCHVAGTPKLPTIITKDGDFNRFIKVTWKLVMQVPGVFPPPPPDEFANGTS